MIGSLQMYVRQGKYTLRTVAADPRAQKLARIAAYFLGGFVLSAASLNHIPQPLGLAFVCVCGGLQAIPAAVGGCVGYLLFWGSAGYPGLLWMAGGLVAALVTGQRRALPPAPLLMPAVAGFIVSATGVISQLWLHDTTPVFLYLLTVVTGGLSTWVLNRVKTEKSPVSEWIVGAMFVLALAQITYIPYLNPGYIAAGFLAVNGAFPAAALAGAALDLSGVAPVSMTAVLCCCYFVRFLPRYPKWAGAAAPAVTAVLIMRAVGVFDPAILPGLCIGGICGILLPSRTGSVRRRGEVGVAQVRLEMAAGVLEQTKQLLLEAGETAIDETALVIKAAERSCAGCSYRDRCPDRARLPSMPGDILHAPLQNTQELPVVCRKSGRVLSSLQESQEQLRGIRADRERRQEYRGAVIQQYRFLSEYLQSLSDHLGRRMETVKQAYCPYVRIFGNRPREDTGDRCFQFPGVGCRHYVLLCDGMGTGMGAVQAGHTAGQLLQRMLTAGFPAKYALRSLNSLCALREQAGIVTVDLAELQLDTGRVVLYKWGAPASFLITKSGADPIGQATPPPGLSATDTEEAVFYLSARRGETVILVSDGLAQEDVLRRCRAMAGESPGNLASALLSGDPEKQQDDATVIVIRLDSA